MQKKSLLAITLALTIASALITSCSKTDDWTCTCTKDGNVVYKTVAYDAKKKTEKEACDKMEEEITGAKCSLSK